MKAFYTDVAYQEAGAEFVNNAVDIYKRATVIFKIRLPVKKEILCPACPS